MDCAKLLTCSLAERAKQLSEKKEIKMTNVNIQSQVFAAFAALFSAAIFVGASVGPAASLVA